MKNTKWNFLSEQLHSFILEQGHKNPSPVQEKVWAPSLDGESLNVLAQTGSGKTLAYALPLIESIKRLEADSKNASDLQSAPRAIIFCPTKELVRQVCSVLKLVTHHAKCRVRPLVADRSLKREVIDIVVTTPGKALAALRKRELDLSLCTRFVLDEADQLLDAHFIKEIGPVWKAWLQATEGQTHPVSLFSATMPPDFTFYRHELFGDLNFQEFQFEGGHQVQKTIETLNFYVSGREKDLALEEFIVKRGGGKGIVFFNRKQDVIDKSEAIIKRFADKKIFMLHGEMGPKDRKKVLDAFKTKNAILLATDIAARGLDIMGLNWVVNFDLPKDSVYYIHRCGRVGRHDEIGYVFNLIGSRDEKLIAPINDAIKNQSLLRLKPLRASSRPITDKRATKASATTESSTKTTRKVTKKSKTRKEEKKEKFFASRKKVVTKRKPGHLKKKTKKKVGRK